MIPIRILIVADDPLIRSTLAKTIGEDETFQLVGAANSRSISQDIDLFNPEIVLADLGWDASHASDIVTDFSGLGLPVVALVPDGFSPEAINPSFIHGILSRGVTNDRLTAALMAVQQGLIVTEPGVYPPASEPVPQHLETVIEPLTQRELEVLALLAEGLSNKAIARRMQISDHTVKFHVNAILGKLNAQSRTDAVVRATRLGWIRL